MKRTEFSTETFDTGVRLIWKHRNGATTQIDIIRDYVTFRFTEAIGKTHNIQLSPEMMTELINRYD